MCIHPEWSRTQILHSKGLPWRRQFPTAVSGNVAGPAWDFLPSRCLSQCGSAITASDADHRRPGSSGGTDRSFFRRGTCREDCRAGPSARSRYAGTVWRTRCPHFSFADGGPAECCAGSHGERDGGGYDSHVRNARRCGERVQRAADPTGRCCGNRGGDIEIGQI
jgi:hypothetical protein